MTTKQDTRTSSTITRRGVLAVAPVLAALPVGAAIGHALASGAACTAELPDGAGHPLMALWREVLELTDAYNSSSEDGDQIWAALGRAEDAIEEARPDDPVGLAVQARYLERSLNIGSNEFQPELAGAIGAALARLGGVDVPAADAQTDGSAS